MSDFFEIKQKATALRKHKDYEKAIEFYKEMEKSFSSLCNEWDLWGHAYCLKKLERYSEALEVCRKFYRMNRDFVQGNNLYAWCIYHLEVRKEAEKIENEENFLKAAGAIVNLCKDDKYSEYTPYKSTVFRVLDYLKSKPVFPAKEVMKWTDLLEPEKLPSDCYSCKNKKGKNIRLPSFKEKWYLVRTDALEEMKNYSECMELCREALSSIPSKDFLHSIWIKRRIALCKWRTGNMEEASLELKEILSIKREWYIQHEIAEILYDSGKIEEAMEYAAEGMVNRGEPEKKWKLFMLAGIILKTQGKVDFAKKHILFSFKLREEKGWKIPEKLEKLIRELEMDTSSGPSAEELHKELKSYWKGLKSSDLPLYKGTVKRIFANGTSGFIAGDNGKDYYFKVISFKGKEERLEEGLKVRFHAVKSFDRKKQKESEEAVRIYED